MGIFDDEIKIIDSIEENISIVIKKVIQDNDIEILDYIRKKQLDEKGEDGKGKKLKPDYSKAYVRIRVKKGRQVSHVDTHFTGKFHATLTINTFSDRFEIVTNVDYDKHIIKRYGIDIIQIQQEYLEEIVFNKIIPEIKKMIDDKFAKS